jgi:iron complex transport system substrate-binding protein
MRRRLPRFFRLMPLVCLLGLFCISCAPKNAGNGPAAAVPAQARMEKTASAANAAASTVTEPYWFVVTENGNEYVADKHGNRVPAPGTGVAEYRRIAVISPGAVETFYLIGAEDAIAAIPESREGIWPFEKTAQLTKLGNTARPDLEGIIALEPDLVLGNAMNAAFVADLVSRGYPALIHGADTIEDIFATTLLLGTLTGKRAEAEALVAEKKAALAALDKTPGKDGRPLKGAFLYSVNPVMAFTETSLPGEILIRLGVVNIAAGLPMEQPILSPEYLLAENPDFLFGAMSITKTEDILGADSVIWKTRAGAEANISIIPSALFLRPSPRIVDSLLQLDEQLRLIKARPLGEEKL